MIFNDPWFYLTVFPVALALWRYVWVLERRRWDRPELTRTETRE